MNIFSFAWNVIYLFSIIVWHYFTQWEFEPPKLLQVTCQLQVDVDLSSLSIVGNFGLF